jgi:hypothetical protein
MVQEAKQQGTKLLLMDTQLAFINGMKRFMKLENHYVEITLNDNVNLRCAESREFLARLGIHGEIISTPGHSDDSVTLVLDEGLAFTGDLHPIEFATTEQIEKIQTSWEKNPQFACTYTLSGTWACAAVKVER